MTIYVPNLLSVPPVSAMGEWSEIVCRTFVTVRCESARRHSFNASLESKNLGIASLSKVVSSSIKYSRTSIELEAVPSDKIQVILLQKGTACISQDGRQSTSKEGDIFIFDTNRPYDLEFPNPYVGITLMVSKDHLASRLPSISQMTALRMSGRSPLGSMAASLIKRCVGLEPSNPAQAMRLSASLLDIVSVALETELSEYIAPSSRHMKLLQEIQGAMIERLGNPDLDLEQLCKEHGTSLRTLNRMFARQGLTAMRWLWQQRLEFSRQLMIRGKSRNITEAALMSGFTDLSHFSRTFRQHFGVSPSSLLRVH